MILPFTQGPRSLIFTLTRFRFLRLVISTIEPNGKLREPAVSLFWSNISPLAVRLR